MQALGTQLPTTPPPEQPESGRARYLAVPGPVGARDRQKRCRSSSRVTQRRATCARQGPRGNAFAQEQIIDELAYAAGMDPVAFRKQNVSQTSTDRLLAVLNAATQAANWQPRVAASNLSNETVVTGRGVALQPSSSGVAVVADIEVNKKTGKIVPNTSLRRDRRRARSQPRRGQEPGDRRLSPGNKLGAGRAGRLRHQARYKPRLGHLPNHPLQGGAKGDPHCDSATRPARRWAQAKRLQPADRGPRQRLLRCHWRAARKRTNDARARPRSPQSGRRGVGQQVPPLQRRAPATGPFPLSAIRRIR